jgi:hypothetical protein
MAKPGEFDLYQQLARFEKYPFLVLEQRPKESGAETKDSGISPNFAVRRSAQAKQSRHQVLSNVGSASLEPTYRRIVLHYTA